jgi:hypothetical protein
MRHQRTGMRAFFKGLGMLLAEISAGLTSLRAALDIAAIRCRGAGQSLGPSLAYLIGGGLVQCSCAKASVHTEPSGSNASQVSASLPASVR